MTEPFGHQIVNTLTGFADGRGFSRPPSALRQPGLLPTYRDRIESELSRGSGLFFDRPATARIPPSVSMSAAFATTRMRVALKAFTSPGEIPRTMMLS